MKSFFKSTNFSVYLVGLLLLASTEAISKSGSFFFFGEPKCPKCLLK